MTGSHEVRGSNPLISTTSNEEPLETGAFLISGSCRGSSLQDNKSERGASDTSHVEHVTMCQLFTFLTRLTHVSIA